MAMGRREERKFQEEGTASIRTEKVTSLAPKQNKKRDQMADMC